MKTKMQKLPTNSRRRTTLVVPDRAETSLGIKSILVPYDFSPSAQRALKYAEKFASQFGAKIILLNVVEPTATPDFVKSFPLAIENDKLIAATEEHLMKTVKDQDLDPSNFEKVLVRYGRSFQEIADAARTLKVDLIIIATHGYTGLKRVLLGSTAEGVVRHAPCPVLVVRDRKV